MAVGLLASTRAVAATETNLYTCPSTYRSIVNLTVAASTGSVSLVRIGIQSAAGAFASKDYIFYDYPIHNGDIPLQITGIVLTELNSIRVYSDTGYVNFHVNGLEELI